jgi:hypothetical protein
MPVILATQEAGVRRIEVPSQPGQIVRETLSQKTLHKVRADKRRNSNGQKTHEKMLTISSNKGNAN